VACRWRSPAKLALANLRQCFTETENDVSSNDDVIDCSASHNPQLITSASRDYGPCGSQINVYHRHHLTTKKFTRASRTHACPRQSGNNTIRLLSEYWMIMLRLVVIDSTTLQWCIIKRIEETMIARW
jgi:hypothetical protein